jgi:hypothetical protein
MPAMRSGHLAVLTMLALAACGSDHHQEAAPDAFVPPVDTPPPFQEASFGGAPQMVKVNGGSVLSAPVVVPIFFASDATMQPQVEDFLAHLSGSSYWSATTSEYGVGGLTILPTIVTTDTPPTTDTALTSWLAGHFNGQNGWPAAPDPQTIYSVFLPDGVVLHTSFGDSCQAFGAYHDEVPANGSQPSVVFSLMPRCQGGLDTLTISTSHELIEAATDPHVESTPAYGDLDPDHYIWAYTPGAEVGDMCEYLPSAAQQLVGNYFVQRTWSNASAAAGHDPCVPVLATPFQGAAPMFTDAEPIDSYYNGTIQTRGVQVPVGMSKTIDVQLFSDAPTGDFSVHADDVAQFLGSAAELSFTWDKQTGHNGDTLHLTITRTKAGMGQGSEFVVVVGSGQNVTALWWGFVEN